MSKQNMSKEEALAKLTKEELWQMVEDYRQWAFDFFSELRDQKNKISKLKKLLHEMNELMGV